MLDSVLKSAAILVVEDEPAAARLLQLNLAAELGDTIRVTVVNTLADALVALARGGWAACVLDLGLPDSYGLDALRAVRAQAPGVPVVVLSGDSHLETAVEALRLGAEDFLDKQTAPGVLIARKVGHVVRQRVLTEELRASRDGLQAVLDSAADGIVTIDARGIVLSFNLAAESIFGWKAAEVIGRNVSMLMPPDTARQHDGYLDRYLGGAEPRVVGIGRQVVGQRRDGTTFPMHLAVSDVAVRGRRIFTGIISDLTELKAAERRAEERGCLVEAILHGTPDPIFAKDTQGRYLLVNEACCTVFGRSMSEIIGRTDRDLSCGAAADAILAADQRVLGGGGVIVVDEELPTPIGLRTFAVTKGPLLGADGELVGLVGVARDTTDVIAAQRELKERNRLLALTEDVANVGHWYLEAGSEVLQWSPEVYRIHGLEPATYKPAFQSAMEAVHEGSRKAVRLALTRGIANGRDFSVEARVCRTDGELRDVLIKGAGDMGEDGEVRGLWGIILDITELRRAQTAVTEAGDLLRLSIGALKDAFVLYDPDGRMVVCNDAYETLLGRPLAPGTRFKDVLTIGIGSGLFREALGDEDEWTAKRLRDFHNGGTREMRVGARWFRVTDVLLPSGHVVGTRIDITALREAREAAEAANRAKSEFLSRMSHELRTPLNAILGFAELMEISRKDPVTDRQRDYLGYIRTGGGHLLNLIDDVLDLARIEAGRISLSIEPVDTRALLDDCLNTTRTLAEGQGVMVRDSTLAQALPWLSVDLTRAKQALLNLLSNAIKYNRPPGSVPPGHVTVSAHPQGGFLRLSVADTGVGIPTHRQCELFQPFSRLGQETGEIEGTGIGLTITRRLVEEMGGSIDFVSVEGEGSTFWIDLPLAHQPSAGVFTGDSVPVVAMAGKGGDARRTVLYVEDNPANLALMEEIIKESDGFTLFSAHTAELGLDMARAVPPDIILMDINLPGMDGFQALEALRADSRTRDVPVIALSADALPSTVHRGEHVGFMAYLTKPVRMDVLLDMLNKATTRDAP